MFTHYFCEICWETSPKLWLLGICCPINSSIFSVNEDVIKNFMIIICKQHSYYFETLAYAQNGPVFSFFVFLGFWISENRLTCHIIGMLYLSLWINQLQITTCKKYSINLRQHLSQLLLPDIIRNCNGSTPTPPYKVMINFKNIVIKKEINFPIFLHRLRNNTNNRLITIPKLPR